MNLILTRGRIFLIILLLWAAIYLPSLGTPEFKSEEGRRVLPAVTMLQTGNWIVPSIGGEDYYNKPPGINWVVAISFMLTGQQNELTARLPSALFVLSVAFLIILMPQSYMGLSGRLIAAIVFLTNIGIIEKGRMIEIEAVYVSLTALATLWWINCFSRSDSRWILWIVPCVLLTLGMLVKGPFILIFFYCVVLAVLFYSKRLKELFTVQHIVALLIFVIIIVGWAYFAAQHTPVDKMTGRMISQLMVRLLPKYINFTHWGGSIIQAFLNFIPWLLFVPALWDKKLTSQIAAEHINLFKGSCLGLILGFAIINLMPGTQPRYSLPSLGLASLLLGWMLSLNKGFTLPERIWKIVLLAAFLAAPLVTITGLIAIIETPAAFFATGLTICIAFIAFRKRVWLQSTLALSLATAVLTVVIMLQYATFGMTLITRAETRRPAAATINKTVPPDETIYVFKPGYQSFLFYVRTPLKYVLEDSQVTSDVHYLLLGQFYWERLKNQPHISCRTPRILCELPDNIRGKYRLVKLE